MAVLDGLGLGRCSGSYIVQSNLWFDNNEESVNKYPFSFFLIKSYITSVFHMVRHWARVKGVLPERLELCCLPAALPLIAHFIVPLLRCCIKKKAQ